MVTVYLYDYVLEDHFFFIENIIKWNIFLAMTELFIFSHSENTDCSNFLTGCGPIPLESYASTYSDILNSKFYDWWDEEVKPVIYVTCNEIKYYFNFAGLQMVLTSSFT